MNLYRKKQKGSSLIEVMIAIVIFAMGVQGLTGLQIVALKSNQGSLSRSVAAEHAYSILDSMRTNVVAARDGAYNTALMAASSVVSANPATGTLAQHQLHDWAAKIVKDLPNSKVQVCRRSDAAASGCSTATGANPALNVFVVKIQWQPGVPDDTDAVGVFEDEAQRTVEIVGRLWGAPPS